MNDLATDKVTKLRPEADATQPVQFTVRRILDKECDITATTAYFPKEGERPDAVLDSMIAAMGRQKALHDIQVQERQIDDALSEIETVQADQVRMDKDLAEQIAELEQQLETSRGGYTRTFANLKERIEQQDGKTFDPDKPGNRAKLDPFAGEIKKLEDDIKALQNKRASDGRQLRNAIAATESRITQARVKIEKLRKLAV